MATQTDPLQGIAYTIYTFNKQKPGDKAKAKWEKHDPDGDMQAVISQAEKMFKSGKYQKVEVKQKYFDKKKHRNIDMTLKVYEEKAKREINVVAIFLFAIICGIAAFGVTYFINNR